jgi:hypothetical protein
MAIIDTLKAAQGGAALAELGKAFGLDATQAAAVVAAVVPELTRKVERNTLSRGGLADLVQALGQGHHREYLRNPALYRHPGAIADGKGILDHLVGGKDGSRGIADRAAQASGVDAAVIREMLPVVAGMTMGGLSREVQGAFGDILGRMGLPMPEERQMGGGGRMGIPDVSQLPGGDTSAGLPMGNEPLPPQQRPRGAQTGGWGGNQGSGQGSSQGSSQGGYEPGEQDQSRGGWGQQPQPQPRGRSVGDGGVRTNSGGGLEMPDSMPQGGDQGYGRGAPGGQGQVGQGQVGQGRGGMPFPFPQGSGGDNPYGDLADILRKGLGLPGGNDGPVTRGPGQRRGQQSEPSDQGSGFPFPMPGGGGQGGGMPFPMPGGGGQGGGMQLPGGAIGGGLLWQIIRSVLGGASGGFQSKGIMGWIIKAVIMRYGWSILKGVLGRGMGR